MSTPSSRPSSGGSSPIRRGVSLAAKIVLLALAATWLAPRLHSWYAPAEDAGIRAIDRQADKHEVAKVRQAEPVIAKKVGGDDREFGNALKNFGSEDAGRRNDRYAAISRAKGEVPVVAKAEVLADQHTWVTMAPAFEPLHVTVLPTDYIKPYERSPIESTAEGIYPEGLPPPYERDLTVLMKDRKDRGMQMTDVGNLFELIGRVCNGSNCTVPLPMGTDSVICQNPGGYLQAWHNGRLVIGGLTTTEAFANGVGRYRLNIVPDAYARGVCALHPDASIYKTKTGPNPGTILTKPGNNK